MAAKYALQNIERYLGAQMEDVNQRRKNGTERATGRQAKPLEQTQTITAAEGAIVQDAARRARTATAFAPHSKPAIRRILVAVDHAGHPAIDTALALAGPLGAAVAIVHVLEPLNGMAVGGAYDYPEMIAHQNADGQKLLNTIEQNLPEKGNVVTSLRQGTAAVEIVNAAQEWNADLIVMGTHRRGPMARFFMGSASQAVLRHGACPVMFVGDTFAVAEPAIACRAAE